jgi:polar amino acid transport system substrate-binding protein
MRTRSSVRRASGAVAAAVAVAITVGACGSGDGSSGGSGPSAGTGAVAAGKYDAALFAMLPARIQQSKTIVASNPLTNPPVAFLGTDGKTLNGVTPDLSKGIESVLGVKFKWINTPFAGLIPGLQADKFDVIWGSVTDTKEREKVLDFVDYTSEGARLMVAKDNPKKVTDIESLCGLNASALSGSVQIALLNTQSTKCTAAGKGAIKVTVYPALPEAELALRSGKVDAFFAGLGSANYHARAEGNGKLYAAIGPTYSPQMVGMGMRKNDGQLAQAMQGAIRQLIANGTYADVLKKYGYQDLALKADQVTINGGIT